MKKTTAAKLEKIAIKENNLLFHRVAKGEVDMLAFLNEYIKQNDLGGLSVSGTTLKKLIEANNARKKLLEKWQAHETNEIYRKLNEKQIKILDDYAETQLIEIITKTEILKEQAAIDTEQREKEAARKAKKTAE